MMMEEREAILKIEKLMLKLEVAGCDVSSIRHFFEVGEWLIAFEGIENLSSNLKSDSDAQDDINLLQRYFSD